MKKETKFSILTFIVVFLVSYVAFGFIPDEVLKYTTVNGSLLSFLGEGVTNAIGMRAVISIAISVIVTLLIRIVDGSENQEKAKKTTKKTVKKETK